MLALSVVELVLTFALAFILLTPSLASFKLASVHFATMCSLIVCFTAFVIGLYRPQMFERARGLLFSTVLSAFISFPAIWIVSKGLGLSSYWPVGYDSFRPVKIIGIWCLGVLCVRLLFLVAARFDMFLHRVAIIGHLDSPSVAAAIRAGRKSFLEVSVISPERASVGSLASKGIRTIAVPFESRNLFPDDALSSLAKLGIKVQSESEFWEQSLRRIDIASFDDKAPWASEIVSIRKSSSIVIRVFDVCASFGLLFATLPIMAIVAALVCLDSAGPILYRQERVGLNNRPFTLLKFRSMRVDAEFIRSTLGPTERSSCDPYRMVPATHQDRRVTATSKYFTR